jgi:hypothetical protein
MARTTKSFSDPNMLEAALEGLLLQKQRIEAQIQEVRSLLGRRRGSAPARVEAVEPSRPARKRELSEAARKRIAAAQKKRWAEYRKKQTRGE